MRIAFFVSAFPLLSETFVLNQVTGLLDRGHQVDIWANRPGGEKLAHAEVERYRLAERTFLHGHAPESMPRNRGQRWPLALRKVAAKPRLLPLLLCSVNVKRFGRFGGGLSLFFAAAAFAGRDTHYDVVHCHFGPNGVLAADLKSLGVLTAPIVTTFHGMDMSQDLDRDGHRYRHLFARGDLFLPISDTWRRKLLTLGAPVERTLVHHMGIDPSRFQINPSRPPELPPRLLTVARLAEKKGVEYALRAVAQVVHRVPELQYRIVGDGPLREPLRRLATELGIAEQVTFLGARTQAEVADLMGTSDIFLLPSVTDAKGDQEGIPVVLMEAMARGLPVLSTKHSGIPELVHDGINGYLVAERDVEALTARLGVLLQMADLGRCLGEAGRREVEEYFHIDRLNERLLELFERLRRPAGERGSVWACAPAA
jgi:colanic acid/amylovoran biosynthesis glycosyltransferase